MSTQANKQIMRRFVEEFQTQGNETVLYELLAENGVDHTPLPGFPTSREGVKQLMRLLRAAMPDLRAVIHDMLAEDDRVVTRKSFVGTHRGELFGIPPTGKQISIDLIDIVRLDNGQIVEHWNVVDQLGLMQQLGAVPA